MGFYYLQSRYYDPSVGRFVNADGQVEPNLTEGLNLFAYRGNNPVNNVDPTGHVFLNNAIKLLITWLFGNGSKQVYLQNSSLAKKIKKSKKMIDIVNTTIYQYKTDGSQNTFSDGVEFTREESGWDLFLAVQHCNYSITVYAEERTRGIFKKHTKIRYVAEVKIEDEYNFDNIREWNSAGSILNNIAYISHEAFSIGNDFEWEANYVYTTKWERIGDE